MKTQIKRFSPHQNAKVFAALMSVGSLVFVVPFMVMSIFMAPEGSTGFPLFMVVVFPVFYLVFGYLMVAVSCWFYNFMFKYTGGIEFEHGDA